MSSVTVGRITAEVAGDGGAVIMVHGLGGSSNTFQTQMPVLGGHRVIRPDLPGSARTPFLYEPLSIDGFVKEIGTMARPRVDIVARNAINRGDFPGPRILAATPELTPTAGLADISVLQNHDRIICVMKDGEVAKMAIPERSAPNYRYAS